MLEKRPHFVPCVIVAVMLFLALASWPYGYYQLLRIFVCGVSAYAAFLAYNCQRIWATWIFGFIAVLFNPLIPIHLSRELWEPIDVVCGVLFIVIAIKSMYLQYHRTKNEELKGK